MTEEHYMTLDEIRTNFNGPEMVFSHSLDGVFALLVRMRTHGPGHFMWRIGPNRLASQWLYFKEFSLENFKGCDLKFVSNPNWTPLEKGIILSAVLARLQKPWWKTLYDVPGIFGELFGWDWLNLPSLDFCSEMGKPLALVDPEYNLKSPSPADLNRFTKERGIYKVTGRYSPD